MGPCLISLECFPCITADCNWSRMANGSEVCWSLGQKPEGQYTKNVLYPDFDGCPAPTTTEKPPSETSAVIGLSVTVAVLVTIILMVLCFLGRDAISRYWAAFLDELPRAVCGLFGRRDNGGSDSPGEPFAGDLSFADGIPLPDDASDGLSDETSVLDTTRDMKVFLPTRRPPPLVPRSQSSFIRPSVQQPQISAAPPLVPPQDPAPGPVAPPPPLVPRPHSSFIRPSAQQPQISAARPFVSPQDPAAGAVAPESQPPATIPPLRRSERPRTRNMRYF